MPARARIIGATVLAAAAPLLLGAAVYLAATATRPTDDDGRLVGEAAALRVNQLTMHGAELRDAGHYAGARRTLRRALTLAERTFGRDSLEVASVLNQLGMVGKYDGHVDEAPRTVGRSQPPNDSSASSIR